MPEQHEHFNRQTHASCGHAVIGYAGQKKQQRLPLLGICAAYHHHECTMERRIALHAGVGRRSIGARGRRREFMQSCIFYA